MQDLLGQKLEDVEEPSRELTVEEVLEIAIRLQQDDRLAEADAVYGQILAAAPDHPRALHYAGVLAHQLGRSGDGIALMEKSLAAVPDRADWYNNLGIVLQECGRLDDAVGAYHRAIALDPGTYFIHPVNNGSFPMAGDFQVVVTEGEVAELREEVAGLRQVVEEFKKQFE